MEFNLNEAIKVLARGPKVIRAMLKDLPKPWIHNDYGKDTFSPFDVVGHLIHGEREDWIPRARIILEHGTSRAFEPFDRYAMYEQNKGKNIDELLDTFARLRKENLTELRRLNLTARHMQARGVHPALGEVTMRQLLAMWVVHDLNHIAQIAKAMAFQYRDQVGPWLRYSSILKPPAPAE